MTDSDSEEFSEKTGDSSGNEDPSEDTISEKDVKIEENTSSEKEIEIEFEGDAFVEDDGNDSGDVIMQAAPDKVKKLKKGAVLNKQVDPALTLEAVDKKAEEFINTGGQLSAGGGYMTRKIGECILFQETSEEPMSFAYKCPKCGVEEAGTADFEKPYTLECSGCGEILFIQEKVKKPKKKK